MSEEEPVTETTTMAPMRQVDVAERESSPPRANETVFELEGLTARYGSNLAVKDVSAEIYKNVITAVIGP